MKKGHLVYFLFLVLAAAALLPALAAGFYFYGSAKSLLNDHSEEQIRYYNSLVSEEITAYAERNGTLVKTLFAPSAGAGGAQNAPAHDFAVFAPDLIGAVLINAKGVETALIGARPRADYGEVWPAVYKTCIEDGQVFTGVIRKNLYRKQLLLNMAFPVASAGGLQERSCAVSEFNMQPLERALSRLSLPDTLTLVFTKAYYFICRWRAAFGFAAYFTAVGAHNTPRENNNQGG